MSLYKYVVSCTYVSVRQILEMENLLLHYPLQGKFNQSFHSFERVSPLCRGGQLCYWMYCRANRMPNVASLFLRLIWEGLFTANICMINLWTLALPAWLNTLHFAKNSMSASTVSIHIHLGNLQLLELGCEIEGKKISVGCHIDVSSCISLAGDGRKKLIIFKTIFFILLFIYFYPNSQERC